MKLTRAQKKARLRQAADDLIEKMLDWDEANGTPNLTQIEDEVLLLRQRFGEEMAAVLATGQEAQKPVEPPRCKQCGAEMRNKGGKVRLVESRVGELTIERDYYYCARCASGLFPPGQTT